MPICTLLGRNPPENNFSVLPRLSRSLPRGSLVDPYDVDLTILDTWTNQTLADELCPLLNEHDATTISIWALSDSMSIRLMMPDCFYLRSSNAYSVSLKYIILQGNSTHPDPLARLARAISPTPTALTLFGCKIVKNDGSAAKIDWNSITSITSSVSELFISNTNLGMGATIPTFPGVISALTLSFCGISGSLPAQLFTEVPGRVMNQLQINIVGDPLSGVISPTIFAGVDFTTLINLRVFIPGHSFTGTFPTGVFDGDFSLLQNLVLDISTNSFSGPLTNVFASSTFSSADLTTFRVDCQNNQFDGAIPSWLSAMTYLKTYTLNIYNNKLNSLAGSPFAVSGTHDRTAVTVVANTNALSGALASPFFNIPFSPDTFTLDLSSNELSSFSANLFDNADFSGAIVTMSFKTNQLTGNMPNVAGRFGSAATTYTALFSSNNALTGTVPPTFLASFCANGTSATASKITLDWASTGLSGLLTFPDCHETPLFSLSLAASDSMFSSMSFPNASSGLVRLLLNNVPVTGSLPDALFSENANLQEFVASNSLLDGPMPDMEALNPSALTSLRLDQTKIDFCSGSRSVWEAPNLSFCNLQSSSAFSCKEIYPKCLTSAPPAPTAPVAPVPGESPNNAPSAVPTAPSSEPSSDTPFSTPIGSVPSVGSPSPSDEPTSDVPTPAPSGAASLTSITFPLVCFALIWLL